MGEQEGGGVSTDDFFDKISFPDPDHEPERYDEWMEQREILTDLLGMISRGDVRVNATSFASMSGLMKLIRRTQAVLAGEEPPRYPGVCDKCEVMHEEGWDCEAAMLSGDEPPPMPTGPQLHK